MNDIYEMKRTRKGLVMIILNRLDMQLAAAAGLSPPTGLVGLEEFNTGKGGR